MIVLSPNKSPAPGQLAYAELREKDVALWNGARLVGDKRSPDYRYYTYIPPTTYPFTGIAAIDGGVVITDAAGNCFIVHWKES